MTKNYNNPYLTLYKKRQREACQRALKLVCGKRECNAQIGEACVNLTIRKNTGIIKKTAWPHKERMPWLNDPAEKNEQQKIHQVKSTS
jgi:hypothetical protein